MTVALGAPFRNSAHRVAAYMIRVRRLQDLLGTSIRVIAGEGDSTDRTRQALLDHSENQGIALDLLSVNHGGPVYGSVEHPERFRQLSLVQNAIFNAVRPTDDVFVYLEHDLVWEPSTVAALINMAVLRDGVAAPLILAEDQKRFYDTWAFRTFDGEQEGARFPSHHDWGTEPFLVASVGSCFAMPARILGAIYDDYSLVGLCRNIRSYGWDIWVDPRLSVWHPDQT